ncbi:DUF6268 family outer membrane beta-barrel protein [Flavobacterium sp. ov086]|uniref:DUF6268 family outer membrane beta-barrel protein n=1 Tax=Flavobacterium sp. ov086 TaxID=1761785 RepID=UPI000B6404A7|nr:DUF6268 family outer membrane beta-barrel protein [Flavobacterium sp. ov086]SNR84954.1 hypothetical protein SAMN04487979_12517 [Flavobacterium sp. ov086]
MKARFLIWVIFSISFFNMNAQENFSVNMNLKTEPTDKIDFNESSIGIKFSKELNAKNQITNTLEYSSLKVNYDVISFKNTEDLDQFNKIENKFEIKHEISNATKLELAITPSANFQQNLDASDFSLFGSFDISQQFNSKTTLKIGVARSAIFGYPKFIPTLSVNYQMNDHSNMLLGFPDSNISYSNNIRNKFSLTNSFNGTFYHLDTPNNFYENANKASLSQMTSAFEYERNVTKNWFLNFKAGYDFNKKYNLQDNDNHRIYDFNTGNGYILGIGIKYKQ